MLNFDDVVVVAIGDEVRDDVLGAQRDLKQRSRREAAPLRANAATGQHGSSGNGLFEYL